MKNRNKKRAASSNVLFGNIGRNKINSLQYNSDIKLMLICTKFHYNVKRTESFALALYQINNVFQPEINYFLNVFDFRTGFIKHNRQWRRQQIESWGGGLVGGWLDLSEILTSKKKDNGYRVISNFAKTWGGG